MQFRLILLLGASSLFIPTASAGEIHKLLVDGKTEKAKALLAKDRRLVGALTKLRETPLHIAAQFGRVEMVKLLLKMGANVHARAYNEFTPLHLATDPRVVKLLLKYGADINSRDCGGSTPLAHAANEGRRQLVKLLWKAGGVFDVESAVLLGDIHRLRKFFRKNPSLARDQRFMCLAAGTGYVLTVKLLLKYKANPNAKSLGMPALYWALEYPDIVKVLLDAGADARAHFSWEGMGGAPADDSTALHIAARDGRFTSAKLLLGSGAMVDARDEFEYTPLHFAAFAANPRMVKLLLTHRADPRAWTKDGWTPMSLAAGEIYDDSKEHVRKNGRARAVIAQLEARGVPIDLPTAIALNRVRRVKELLKRNPVLANRKESGRKPPLHLAVALNRKEIVKVLLGAGASTGLRGQNGQTPLHEACRWKRAAIVRLLIRHRADVNARDESGATPLHEAAQLHSAGIARLLLAAGAKVNARDKEGRTPLSWASEDGKPPHDLLTLLGKFGAKK
jgi:ankyrin repeat protein